jgi:hypothetical protein
LSLFSREIAAEKGSLKAVASANKPLNAIKEGRSAGALKRKLRPCEKKYKILNDRPKSL